MSNRLKVRSLRTISINSLSGHSVIVHADVVTEIPAILAEEAFAKGCIPVGEYTPAAPVQVVAPKVIASLEDSEDVVIPEPVEAPVEATVEEPVMPMRITQAFDILVKRGDMNDFRTSGTPKAASVERTLGRKAMVQEIDAAWALYSTGM